MLKYFPFLIDRNYSTRMVIKAKKKTNKQQIFVAYVVNVCYTEDIYGDISNYHVT